MLSILHKNHAVVIPAAIIAKGDAAVAAYATEQFAAAGITWPPAPAHEPAQTETQAEATENKTRRGRRGNA